MKGRIKSLLAAKIAITLVVVGMAGVGAWLLLRSSGIGMDKTRIDNTATQIAEIKRIGQWEFLAVRCEVLADTVRKRVFPLPGDRLARIYRGTLRLGIDMDDAADDWIATDGDSVAMLKLPALRLLDDRFIDEAATTTFYENGRWDGAAKEALYRSAAAEMRSIALTPHHYDMARLQAEDRFVSLFLALGFNRVEVSFAP